MTFMLGVVGRAVFLKDAAVVRFDDCCDTRHARVTNFHRVSVKDRVKLRPLREVFVYELEKSSSQASSYGSTVGRIEPDDAP